VFISNDVVSMHVHGAAKSSPDAYRMSNYVLYITFRSENPNDC